MPIDLDRSILFAAGAAMLALAILILVVRPGRGINRALAALVAVRGMATLLPQASNDPAWTWTALQLQPYFSLAVVPLALYCVYAFSHSGDAVRRGTAGWLALGAVLALDVAYFLDHSLFHTLAAGAADVGALRAADGIRYTAFGPLWLVVGAGPMVLAYLGLRLAVLHRGQDPLARSPLLLLLASGLTLGALFEGASRLAGLTALLDAPGSFPWTPWGWAVVLLPVLALGPALLAVAVIANRRQAPVSERTLDRVVLVLAAFAFFSGFLRLMAPADSDVAGDPLVLVLMGLWRLAMPAFVAYALVRHPPAPGPSSVQTPPGPAGARAAPLERQQAVR